MKKHSLKFYWASFTSLVIATLVLGFFIYKGVNDENRPINTSGDSKISANNPSLTSKSSEFDNQEVPPSLSDQFPEDQLYYSRANVDLSLILSGGPGKDGIPAISSPKFEPIKKTDIPDNTRGIFIEINGEEKFYPYNILVWHEVVNDTIGGQPIAITFCPLCGSAIAYDRVLDGNEVEFGVSGFLYESNLVMYDRTNTPTLWSQSTGRGIVGDQTGDELTRLPFQLLEVSTVKRKYPHTQIMTTNTGHSRDYTLYPYGDYDKNDNILFDVSVQDSRFSTKEIFYVVPHKRGSVAFRFSKAPESEKVKYKQGELVALKSRDGEIVVKGSNGKVIPGYYEMWFSWATQHQDDGDVWDPSS